MNYSFNYMGNSLFADFFEPAAERGAQFVLVAERFAPAPAVTAGRENVKFGRDIVIFQRRVVTCAVARQDVVVVVAEDDEGLCVRSVTCFSQE